MIEQNNASIKQLAVHRIGNQVNGNELLLSAGVVDLADDNLKNHLQRYFLQSFEWQEYYNFSFSNGESAYNPVFKFCENLFQNPDLFHQTSVDLAKYLYETSHHPQIKDGDLLVAHFQNVILDDELVDALCIFKSESKQAFLDVEISSVQTKVVPFEGIQIDKLDKACIVFNTHKEEGYKVTILDKSNKITEAQYWREQFLNVRACEDAYHLTKGIMQNTKNFITKELPKETELNKSDQLGLLNRSLEYFKNNASFNKSEFEEEVFQDPEIIESFNRYEPSNTNLPMDAYQNSFEISENALKKQARVFKSIIKLDKNFHIYVHGDRELIEQGRESDGRKYYKIYFSEET